MKSTWSGENSSGIAALACMVFLAGTSTLMNLYLGEPFGREPNIATQSSNAILLDFIPERPSPANRPVSGNAEPTSICFPTVGLVCELIVLTVVVSVTVVGETVGDRKR